MVIIKIQSAEALKQNDEWRERLTTVTLYLVDRMTAVSQRHNRKGLTPHSPGKVLVETTDSR